MHNSVGAELTPGILAPDARSPIEGALACSRCRLVQRKRRKEDGSGEHGHEGATTGAQQTLQGQETEVSNWHARCDGCQS